MNVSESMLTYRKEEGGSTLVASAWSWTPKSGRRCPATYGLEPSARDKGNTMNVSESMLTYRKEESGSTLVASAWSWTPKSGADCSDTTSKGNVQKSRRNRL
ncbi:hypothetical protein [Bacillus sp. Hm123]|uniref:hypothetical protein n=1 Tax=Bacillus sp. Hm123 TaxID=3450745 RepID=UPI003F41BDEF